MRLDSLSSKYPMTPNQFCCESRGGGRGMAFVQRDTYEPVSTLEFENWGN